MDDYFNSMENYFPINDTETTGNSMGENEIVTLSNIPNSTALTDDYSTDSIPTYTASRKIEVRRYILKK